MNSMPMYNPLRDEFMKNPDPTTFSIALVDEQLIILKKGSLSSRLVEDLMSRETTLDPKRVHDFALERIEESPSHPYFQQVEKFLSRVIKENLPPSITPDDLLQKIETVAQEKVGKPIRKEKPSTTEGVESSSPIGSKEIPTRPFSYVEKLKGVIEKESQAEEEAFAKSVQGLATSTTEADSLRRDLTDLVKTAEMTINFHPQRIFLTDVTKLSGASGQGILNYWEKPYLDPDPVHQTTRDTVEKRFLGVDNNPLEGRKGDYNIGFSQRPGYAGLNIAKFSQGAAPSYGSSYFVLKDSVKEYTTLLPCDSFDTDKGGQTRTTTDLGDFTHAEALMNRLGAEHLRRVKTSIEDGSGDYDKMDIHSDYVECHIHAPLTWDKVDTIVIDMSAVSDQTISDFRHDNPKLKELIQSKERSSNRIGGKGNEDIDKFCKDLIKSNAEKLASKHGVKIEYRNE